MEEWKKIAGYNDYLVSNNGRIKSLERLVPMPMGGFRKCIEKILKPRIGIHGYYYVNLANENAIKSMCIHKIVALSFIENPGNKRCVNHKDGNKLNNKVSNLEWATHGENNQHAYDTGLKTGAAKGKLGHLNPTSKKVAQYSLRGDLITVFASQGEAERKTGILQGNISAACNGVQNTAGGYKWQIIK